MMSTDATRLYEFLARELNAHFLFSYIIHVYKSKHKRPRVAYVHLRELHQAGLSHHYIPTRKALPQLDAWLRPMYSKLFDKLARMIEMNETYPATIIHHIKPVWNDGIFAVSYNQISLHVPAPPALIKSVHSHIYNSVHLSQLQFICALRADMCTAAPTEGHSDKHRRAENNAPRNEPAYYSIKGAFFSAHPDLMQLLDDFRIGNLVEISFDNVDKKVDVC